MPDEKSNEEILKLIDQIRWKEPSESGYHDRSLAIQKLCSIADASIVPDLIEVYLELEHAQDDVEDVLEAIQVIFESIGEEAIPVLIDLLDTTHIYRKMCVMDILRIVSQPGDQQVLSAIKPFYESTHQDLKSIAISVLTTAGTSEEVPMLLKALPKIRDSRLRWEIVSGLGRIGDERAIPALSKMLPQIDLIQGSTLTSAVFISLERIGTSDAIKAIQEWVQSEAGQHYLNIIPKQKLEYAKLKPSGYRIYDWYIDQDESTPYPELTRLQNEIQYRVIELALDEPELNEEAMEVLEKTNTQRARLILENWKRRQE